MNIKSITIILLGISLVACQPRHSNDNISGNLSDNLPDKQNTGQVGTVVEEGVIGTDNDGAYYLDDGPPQLAEQKIAMLMQTPDAEVKHENFNPQFNRPYTALGKRYVPMHQSVAYTERGMASWYGRRYHGRKTSTGEVYDMFKMTAAHPTLPIPSYVKVTRVKTGEQVIVRVNDRGPFLHGRIIDLSYVAALKLGIAKSGTGEVLVERILPPKNPLSPVESITKSGDNPTAIYLQLGAFAQESGAVKLAQLVEAQMGSLAADIAIVVGVKAGLYHVRVGPFPNREAAIKHDKTMCDAHQLCGFIISE